MRSIQRSMAVYAMGENWTGAMGTGVLDVFVPGHEDGNGASSPMQPETDALIDPLLMYDGPVRSAAVGWGHTVLISDQGRILVSGRPFDFTNLLRLNRFPRFIRMRIIESMRRKPDGQSTMTPPTTTVDSVFAWMSGVTNNENIGREEFVWADTTALKSSGSTLTEVPTRSTGEKDGNSAGKTNGSVHPPGKFQRVWATAGLTALLDNNGDLYTFGLNNFGQCGVGKFSNNTWTPQRVVGLTSDSGSEGHPRLEQDSPITDVALGLQHALALNADGNLFAWGKGERGQLGLVDDSIAHAMRVTRFRCGPNERGQHWEVDPVVTSIGAGMNHSVILTQSNNLYVCGKNVRLSTETNSSSLQDSTVPIFVSGLPPDKTILDVTCGSHHTSVLIEDGSVYGFGIPRDSASPIVEAIQQIPPGVLDLPCRQFEGHSDRTTIVGSTGEQVLQLQLWDDPLLREHALFQPSWRDSLTGPVLSVHRGWLHTIVVTDEGSDSVRPR